MSNTFAAAVHRLRRLRGLTITDVAGLTKYSESYLSKMLNGHRRLLPEVVEELDAVLDGHGELVAIAWTQARDNAAHIAARPVQLPPAASDFVGRENYLFQMDEALMTQAPPHVAVTAVIEGGVWTGKTALALRWAARMQDRFPGGVLFADLHGLSDTPATPGEVLTRFLCALGAPGEAFHGSVHDRAARYRSRIGRRPVLVVLDNVANYEQICPLLPGAGSAVVITSRGHQAALAAHTGALCIDLPALSVEEALDLLGRCVGSARVEVDPDAANKVTERCGRLPMALLLAAEQLRQREHSSVRSLAETLSDPERLLDLCSSLDPALDIRTLLGASTSRLPELARKAFRFLGDCPTESLSPHAAAALLNVDQEQARQALATLTKAHLVESLPTDRVRLAPLEAAFAREQALATETAADRRAGHGRLARWYTATAWEASNTLVPRSGEPDFITYHTAEVSALSFTAGGYEAAIAWCDTEIENALRVARHARHCALGDISWRLPSLFLPYFYVGKNWRAWLAAAHDGLAAAEDLGIPIGIACSEQSLGWVLHELGRSEQGIVHLQKAQALHAELGDQHSQAWTCFSLASALAALGCPREARDTYRQAQSLFEAVDSQLGVAITQVALAGPQQALGHAEESLSCARQGLARARRLALPPLTAFAHQRMGILLHHQRAYRSALTEFDAALKLRRRSGERWSEADTLTLRGDTLAALGDLNGAHNSYCEASDILAPLHDPRTLDTQSRLAALTARWELYRVEFSTAP